MRGVQNGEGIAYVRPHDLEVDRYVAGGEGHRRQAAPRPCDRPAGPARPGARRQRAADRSGDPERALRQAGLREGETLLVRPRRMQVFVDQGGGI
jgi:sulfate transport system ATP-binding protein